MANFQLVLELLLCLLAHTEAGISQPTLSRSSPVTVQQGSWVSSITCSAYCNPYSCSYIWRKRSSNAIITRSSALSLGTAARYHDGKYYCEVNSKNASSKYSADIEIDVQYGPNTPSLSRSSPVTVEEGRQVPNIDCSADCHPKCSFTWHKSGKGTVTSNNVLSLGIADRSESGQYNCKAKNKYESKTSNQLTVNIEYGPGIPTLSQNTQITLVEGKEVPSITCTAQCNPTCKYVWTKRGHGKVRNDGVLSLGNADKSEDGTYYCTVSNTHGTKNSADITIDVKYPPSITDLTISSTNHEVTEGQRVQMTCVVDSDPTSTIDWYYRYSSTANRLPLQSTSNNALKLENVMCTQTGTYICIASNGIEPYDEMETFLPIFCSPKVESMNTKQTNITYIGIATGETLELSVDIVLYPVNDIRWYFHGSSNESLVPLQNGTSRITIRTILSLYSITSRLDRTTLSRLDFGNYTMEAENRFGKTKATFVVLSQGKPSVPTSLLARCTSETAEISWIPGFDGGDTQTFYVQYGTDGEVMMGTGEEQQNMTKIVRDLQQNTLYTFRVVARNKYGTTISAEMVNCTTLEKQSPNQAGLIVGAVIGCLAVISVLVFIGIMFVKHRQNDFLKFIKGGFKRKDHKRGHIYDDIRNSAREANTYDGTVAQVYDNTTLQSKIVKQSALYETIGVKDGAATVKYLVNARKENMKEEQSDPVLSNTSQTKTNIETSEDPTSNDVAKIKHETRVYENTKLAIVIVESTVNKS